MCSFVSLPIAFNRIHVKRVYMRVWILVRTWYKNQVSRSFVYRERETLTASRLYVRWKSYAFGFLILAFSLLLYHPSSPPLSTSMPRNSFTHIYMHMHTSLLTSDRSLPPSPRFSSCFYGVPPTTLLHITFPSFQCFGLARVRE